MRLHLYIPALLACVWTAHAQDITLHDSARGRDIPAKVYAPANKAGSAPVIIFSPGYGAGRDEYGYLGKGWSQAGYVVVVAQHPGSDARGAIANLRTTMKNRRNPEDKGQWTFELQAQRAQDISFVISSLNTIEQTIASSGSRPDPARVGVAGHSDGGGTTLVIAGAVLASPEGQHRSLRDPRVRAAIGMSPQGAGNEGFDAHSWDDIRIPTMTMSGSRDKGSDKQSPEWRLEPYQHMPPGNKYEVLVNGAGHLNFAIGSKYHDCILAESTAFWDVYLRGQTGAKSKLVNSGECIVQAK